MKYLFLSILFLFIAHLVKSQQYSFCVPVKTPIVLNGNFGEIRANHFHAGIDIKTNGTTGMPVFSIEDGFISRISVSSTGYGNVIYIEHPFGFTSVYGHLEKFIPEIEDWVKKQQYKNRCFEINLEPDIEQFPVKKNQQIAFSGNSGSSGGPHLHFELRKTADQHPVNPLLNGFKVKDTSKPVAQSVYFYPLSDFSHVNGSNVKAKFNLVLQNGFYKIKEFKEPIPVWGDIGFGVDALDYLDGNWSKCGIYKLEIWDDSLLINSFKFDELAYEKMRQINSHVDYEKIVLTNEKIQKTFIEPGNQLAIYSNTINKGICTFKDGKKHRIRIKIYDALMNNSDIVFTIQTTEMKQFPKKNFSAFFQYDKRNSFENEYAEIIIPEYALFTNLNFEFKELPSLKGTYSGLFQFHNHTVPLARYVDVKIKANMLPEHLRDKAAICQVDPRDHSLKYLGGVYSFGWIKTETRTFGDMCIAVDTIPPVITALSFIENKYNDRGQLRFKITDNLSGIKTYNGFIDDKWALFEFDSKNNFIRYVFDEHIQKGRKHQVLLIVEDEKANRKEYRNTFYY